MTIPPHQTVDILLGKPRCPIPPKPGFVITAPDPGLDSRTFLTMGDAERGLAEMRDLSRWPDSLFIRPAWIHDQEMVLSRLSNRSH